MIGDRGASQTQTAKMDTMGRMTVAALNLGMLGRGMVGPEVLAVWSVVVVNVGCWAAKEVGAVKSPWRKGGVMF